MNKSIWKYELQVTDNNRLELPKGAKILSVQTQYNVPCIWAEVDRDEQEKEVRFIETFGTGHKIPNSGPRNFIGTYQLQGGMLVFHV